MPIVVNVVSNIRVDVRAEMEAFACAGNKEGTVIYTQFLHSVCKNKFYKNIQAQILKMYLLY